MTYYPGTLATINTLISECEKEIDQLHISFIMNGYRYHNHLEQFRCETLTRAVLYAKDITNHPENRLYALRTALNS